MAKMHSRGRGSSGSTKPAAKTTPTWTRYSEKELEMLIGKLAKEGLAPSQIGLHLRDVYGVPSSKIITKKRLTVILKEKGLMTKLPENLLALIKKSVSIRKHMEKHKQDQTSKRGLLLTESKINRLVKYYKRAKVLPADWTYDSSKIRLYLE